MTRTILLSVCVLALLTSAFSPAMGQVEEALVAYWPFDDGAGDEANDASGNGHDGTLEGEANWVDGKFDKALDFGPGGGHIVVPDDDALDIPAGVTYMAWFNLNESIVGQRRMMSKNDAIFVIFDFGDATSLDFLVKPNNDFVESTTAFEVGDWYKHLIPAAETLADWHTLDLTPDDMDKIKHGHRIPAEKGSSGWARGLSEQGDLIALLQAREDDDAWQPRKVFITS